jgi:hypothetical protein
MADLSPAAQAVLDAYIQGLATKRRNAIAAALRAAVKQKIRPDSLMGIDCILYARDILDLANELDPTPCPQSPNPSTFNSAPSARPWANNSEIRA